MSSLEATLAAGRAEAEALMVDAVDVYRPGPDVFDRDTGLTVPGPHVVDFYDGKARVKPDNTAGREVQSAERLVVLRTFTVSLPWSTPLPASGERPIDGDVIDVTASPNPQMVGLRLWVMDVEYSATATAWRISAEVRT